MMIFPEINSRTRPFLTKKDVENKWIWLNCKHVINVSLYQQDDIVVDTIIQKSATYEWIPMAEKDNLNLDLLCKAMKVLLSYNSEEIIVHCDYGNNRSRMVCEFASFAKTGKWIVDELSVGLDGCANKTEYNIKHGYLPDILSVEQTIKDYLKNI